MCFWHQPRFFPGTGRFTGRCFTCTCGKREGGGAFSIRPLFCGKSSSFWAHGGCGWFTLRTFARLFPMRRMECGLGSWLAGYRLAGGVMSFVVLLISMPDFLKERLVKTIMVVFVALLVIFSPLKWLAPVAEFFGRLLLSPPFDVIVENHSRGGVAVLDRNPGGRDFCGCPDMEKRFFRTGPGKPGLLEKCAGQYSPGAGFLRAPAGGEGTAETVICHPPCGVGCAAGAGGAHHGFADGQAA